MVETAPSARPYCCLYRVYVYCKHTKSILTNTITVFQDGFNQCREIEKMERKTKKRRIRNKMKNMKKKHAYL